jgi:hypothetical protein
MSNPKPSHQAAWLLASKENKDDVVRFRVSASQKAIWEEALGHMGVRDFSSFYRGAIEAAIVMSERADDPTWQKFLKDIQAASKKRFGSPTALHGAKDYEYAGRGVKSVLASEVFKSKK